MWPLHLHPLRPGQRRRLRPWVARWRSEEHTSELQSHSDLVCRLLLEKKKKNRGKRVFRQLDENMFVLCEPSSKSLRRCAKGHHHLALDDARMPSPNVVARATTYWIVD